MVSLGTFNVRGLRNPLKRKKVFDYIRSTKTDIMCLQETHCGTEEEKLTWGKEWGGKAFWSNKRNNSGGTCVLLSKQFSDYNLKKQLFGIEGRMQLMLFDFKTIDQTILLINVYAPNGKLERKTFYEKVSKEIKDTNWVYDGILFTGDFNCVCSKKDKSRFQDVIEKDKSAQFLAEMCNNFDLEDIWRRLNPEKRQYTWRQLDSKNAERNVSVRLDRWMISKTLVANAEKCSIIPCQLSDHLPVTLRLSALGGIKRGKGVWKLNNDLLHDEHFCQEINLFWDFWRTQKPDFGPALQVWWEEGKEKMKEISIKFGKKTAKQRNRDLLNFQKNFNDLLIRYDKNPDQILAGQIQEFQKRIEALENERVKGAKIRSRCKWYEDGEKSSSYFLKLEKYRGETKLFSKIIKQDGSVSSDQNDIMETQVNFYEELYSSEECDQSMQDYFLNNIGKTLKQDEAEVCEGPVTLKEANEALLSMGNNKSPGADGFTKEFYVRFWNILGQDLVNVLNLNFEMGQMTESQKEAIVTLLYKKGDRADIKNWRPISLLCIDYKILTKILATRLRKVIDKIIENGQTCGIPGRSIFENIIVCQDAIFYSNKYNKPLVILSLDQSKAFDRVNRGFLIKTLKKFGFGPSFVKWIETIYSDIESKIISNGFLSRSFSLKRGLRQGCPLSPLLYIMVAESLACTIRKDPQIKGFKLPDNTEQRVVSYADDMATLLSSIESIPRVTQLCKDFGKASESKVNIDKTLALLCGSLKNNIVQIDEMQVLRDKMNLLGVWIGNEDTESSNWDPIIKKVQNICNLWSGRDLTIYGKSIVLNILALSKLWYVGTVQSPSDQTVEKINKIIWTFLWKNKRALIAKERCVQNIIQGGVGIIDVKIKLKCLKLKWLEKLLSQPDAIWVKMARFFLDNYDKTFKGIYVLASTMKYQRNNNIPKFYVDLIEGWKTLEYERKIPETLNNLLSETIWCNSLFKHNNSILHNFRWIQWGLIKVRDVWNPEFNRLFTMNEIIRKLESEGSVINRRSFNNDFFNITTSIFKISKNINKTADQGSEIHVDSMVKMFEIGNKFPTPKKLYERLMEKQYQVAVHETTRFLQAENRENEWLKWWNTLFKSKLNNKIKEFLWKLTHNALSIGEKLRAWFPGEENGKCQFCKNEVETACHLFFGCNFIKEFWLWLSQMYDLDFENAKGEYFVYFNNFDDYNTGQFYIVAQAKYAIWLYRNSIKFKGTLVDLTSLKMNFKYQMKSHLAVLHQAKIELGIDVVFGF